jgi:hypothetical protein
MYSRLAPLTCLARDVAFRPVCSIMALSRFAKLPAAALSNPLLPLLPMQKSSLDRVSPVSICSQIQPQTSRCNTVAIAQLSAADHHRYTVLDYHTTATQGRSTCDTALLPNRPRVPQTRV